MGMAKLKLATEELCRLGEEEAEYKAQKHQELITRIDKALKKLEIKLDNALKEA